MILPFPGGVAASGVEGRQPLQVHDRQHLRRVLPDARGQLGERSKVPDGRGEHAGDHHQRPRPADDAAGDAGGDRAAAATPGLVRISAGNYGGRLGKSFVWLTRREE